MKREDIITLYDDGDKEVHYFIDKTNRKNDFVLVMHGDCGVEYSIYDTIECHHCYDHIVFLINNKRYADCILECISAIANDWFEEYIKEPGYNDIINHILEINNEQLNK